MNELGKRLLSALIYGALIIVPIALHPIGLVSSTMFLLVIACLEYYGILKSKGLLPGKFSMIIFILLNSSLFLAIIYSFLISSGIFLTASIFSVLYMGLLTVRLFQLKFPFPIPILNGLFYIAVPLSLFVCLGFLQDPYYPFYILIFLSIIWCNDVFAYLVGRSIGKHNIERKISPKKTWEGFIAGLLFSLIWVSIIVNWEKMNSLNYWLGLTVIVVIVSDIGDFVESLFKRKIQIKDSGRLLPGHGGILDRIDSMLFAVPFASLYHLIYYWKN